MSTKKSIKSIKGHLENKDSESALYEATELLKSIGEDAPEASQILTFRGLALTQLGRTEEAEKSYLHAYRLSPANPLASIGLRRMYEKNASWEKLGSFLEVLVQAAYDDGDGEKCAATLQDLLELRSKHGPADRLYQTLDLLLPSSPLIPLLQPLPAPSGSYVPFPSPIYPPPSFDVLPSLPSPLPHALHLVNSLPLLLNLLVRQQGLAHTTIEAKVKAGRTRLGAGPEKEVRRQTDAEVLGSDLGLKIVELLKETGSHPDVSEETRREVEVQEFGFWRRLLGALSSDEKAPAAATKAKGQEASTPTSTPKAASQLPTPELFQPKKHSRPTKEEALSRVDSLAKGFVLLDVTGNGAEEGWKWVIEGTDEPTLFYDLEVLHKYAKAFPESRLTDFIDDYCRWFKLPLPDPEEEEAVEASTQATGDADKQAKKKPRGRKNKAGMNARERRKARRAAGKEGVLAEDIDQEERDELVAAMTRLLNDLPKSIFVHRVMARIALQEEDWGNAIGYAEKGRNLVKELVAERGTAMPNVQASLETSLAVALVPYFSPKHHPRATRLLNSVLKAQPDNNEAIFARAQIHQSAGQWSHAQKLFQSLIAAGEAEKDVVAAKEEMGWCLVNEGKLAEGRDVLEEVVEIRDSRKDQEGRDDEAFPRARAWWRLGQTEWMIGDYESRQHAEDWFMASIRALPTYAPAFTGLGICYSSATPPDEERALKCFQKAFELDATQAEAAHRLAIGYANEDEWALVRTIAMRVMEGEGGLDGVAGGEVMNAKGRFAPQNGWAWKALGSTEMHYKNYAKAAQAYQIALRAEPDDPSTWTMLGEAYVKCGRHMAGLKALTHVLELQPDNWRGLYGIGETQSQLGAFDQAIEAFEQVMQLTGRKEVGVFAALAEANLSLGRQTAAGGFRERSRRAFHQATTLAMQVLHSAARSHRPWAWKVIGDATFELSGQESSVEEATSSSKVIEPVLRYLMDDDTDRRSQVSGVGHAANLLQSPVDVDHTLKTSIFAYAYRAHLLKNEPRVSTPALYDLATSLHSLASRLNEGEQKTSCLKGAISSIRLALERDAGDERLWNALGVICGAAGAQLAQHAFVVALELYTKDPVVWANLGYLYLRLEDMELANQCFYKSQIIDPDYARAWFGQAILADKNGDKEQAKALFAHSVTLSARSLLEADLAMAISIFTPFLSAESNIDQSILHQSAFALRHYTHQRPRDHAAAHLYALINERLGLIDEAASSLERAASVLEEEFERTESSHIEGLYAVALCNLGRVQLSAGKYQESLEGLNSCWELVSSSTSEGAGVTVGSGAGLKVQVRLLQALAHYWLGQIDESLECFQASLDEATAAQDTGVKEEVAVLLSRTLWGLGGEEGRETAKSNLMECLSQEKPSIKVISTLASIAIVSADPDLVEASISELLSRPLPDRLNEDPAGQSERILYLHALSEGRSEDALSILAAAALAKQNTKNNNRLAAALLAEGKAEQAAAVLQNQNGGVQAITGREEVVDEAEKERLGGIADVLEANGEGVAKLQKGLRVAPWLEEGWEALAWGRKAMEEAGRGGVDHES